MPEDFILSIFLPPSAHCHLPAKSHVISSPGNKVNPPSVELLSLRSPNTLNGEAIPLVRQDQAMKSCPLETPRVSVSSLFCSWTPKYQQIILSAFMETYPETRTENRSPEGAGGTMLRAAQIQTLLWKQPWFLRQFGSQVGSKHHL